MNLNMTVSQYYKMNSRYKNIQQIVLIIWVIIFAASLHILTDINVNNTKLRIGASDIFLPFLIFLLILRNNRVILNLFKINRIILISVLVATLWLLISVINGYLYMGGWQTWALLNKTIGWFVLLGYFICGYLIAESGLKIRNIFIQSFFMAAWIIGIILMKPFNLVSE